MGNQTTYRLVRNNLTRTVFGRRQHIRRLGTYVRQQVSIGSNSDESNEPDKVIGANQSAGKRRYQVTVAYDQYLVSAQCQLSLFS